ncbi:MAG: carboxypeptidase-like regulatory domain-containing protein [Bacteroidota bacterium]
MRMILPFLFTILLIPSTDVFSQLLHGRVMTESGDDAAGVTVRFQNKSNGISTNADGTFKIMATKLPDTLVFSAPGFEPYKVVITEKNIKDPNFEVVLLNARKEMTEVVVTGYGAAGKKDMTYSASTVRRDEMSLGPDAPAPTAIEKALAGKASGVKIRGSSTYKSAYRSAPAGDLYFESLSGETGGLKYFFADTNIGLRTGSAAKSRILTAGEVNDFNKWKMWEEYTENEFKSMGNFWGMMPNKRYSVQLTDKSFNPVINEAVYLVRKETNDTVWKAFTDNTGKAELWAGFFRDTLKPDDYFIADQYGIKAQQPSAFANGVNLLSVDRSCGVTADVDIAFVVDATGSMGDEIEFLKLELEDVIRNTMEKHKFLSLRAASVFYRDKGDAYVTKNAGFNDDLLKTLNFIKLQAAGGGGDTPEALDEALSTALDSLQWNPAARTRLLFLILDAPPHNEAKERIRQLTLKAAAKGIRIVPVACSGTDKSTEFLLRSIALATNGTYAFLTNHSGVGYSHIEPTTDKYEVELLGSLLQRIIGQYLYAKDCAADDKDMVQQPVKQPENILSVKLYPNPTSGLFTIESKKDIKEIFITDFTGKILMRLAAADKKARPDEPFGRGRWQVDIGRYPSGTYLVKYITADNKWGAEKVVLLRI